jgi:hypothetical protein
MTIRLTRTSHGTPPLSMGIEIDDAGRAAGWQTSGNRVGRFAHSLSERELKALDRALAAAKEAEIEAAPDSASQVQPPSGAVEQLTANGLPDLVLDAHEKPPAGFKDLVKLLRKLREKLADSPVAAIELSVAGPPFDAQLRHVGQQSVTVRMGTLSVKATLFKRDSSIADSKTYTVDASGVDGPVGPGWTLPLVDDLAIDAPGKGRFLTVSVGAPEVDALGDGVLRSAQFVWMSE